MDKKQKEFWKQFCQSKNKDEETLKKSLFNGDLTNEEFEYVISCVIGPLSAPVFFIRRYSRNVLNLWIGVIGLCLTMSNGEIF